MHGIASMIKFKATTNKKKSVLSHYLLKVLIYLQKHYEHYKQKQSGILGTGHGVSVASV